MSNVSPSPLIHEDEAAHLLGLAVPTLRRWRWAGQGPRFHKLGAAVRYDPADLVEYIASSRRRSTSDPGPGQDGGSAQ